MTAEQERQVTFIRKAADGLSELVNDLLDLAKVEAGKTVVNPVEFDVTKLFGALRGMLRPLLVGDAVMLVFEDSDPSLSSLYGDEGKVSQILRNFISNALKFTEHGEVRVSARMLPDGEHVEFAVADTGIGIAAEHLDTIFQEFTQVDSRLQRAVKGTGLGLPLCRRLADLLGGSVSVESEVGVGSVFRLVIPAVYETGAAEPLRVWELDEMRLPVLIVEDSPATILLYEKFLASGPFQVLPAATVRAARDVLATVRPKAIVLDIVLRGEDTWSLLAELKRRPDTRDIPLVVVSTVEDEGKGMALGADAYCVKPIDRQQLLQTLMRLTVPQTMRRILIVDDEEISRYVLRQQLIAPQHEITEAASGGEALAIARADPPDVICLDLTMPDMDGFEVLQRLRADEATRSVPVVIVTGTRLEDDDRERLLEVASAVLAKNMPSREYVLSTIEHAMAEGGRDAT